jgi:subtilase family serine protease
MSYELIYWLSRVSSLHSYRCVAFAIALLLCIGISDGNGNANGNPHGISGNTPGFVRKATDLGPVDPNTAITVTVWLHLHNESQLDALVAAQQQRGSGQYHKWITQDQFNASFGPTSQELKSVQNFLNAKQLSTVYVAENNMFVKVQGTVANIQKAFNVQIHNYKLNGQNYRSNTADPSVDDASGAHIAAVTGMDDYGFQPDIAQPTDADGNPFPSRPLNTVAPNGLFFEAQAFRPPQTVTFTGNGHTATYRGNRYGANITNMALGHLPPQGYQPSEVQTAYNLNSVYGAGLDGTGQTVAIVDAYGSSTIAQDAEVFSQLYGLPDLTPANFQIVKAQGISHNPHGVARNWFLETTLDVEWVHAIAPGANIALVLATDHNSLDEGINYAVVHHLGNVISNSWGNFEALGNPARFNRDTRIFQMAIAQGIDVNFSTGDFGDNSPVLGFATVQFPASSPFVTAVGGTSLALNPDNTMAFQTGWGTNLTRIADISPSGGLVFADNPPVVPPLMVLGDPSFNPNIFLGFQGGAGGGASAVFARPSFQSGLSVPGSTRLLPDISFLADPFTGVEIILTDPASGELSVTVIGGTSLASPMFSAMMAIASQKAGHGLGQAAQLVYNLPAGAVTDVTDLSSPHNATGVIDGTTPETADSLASPLGKTTSYFSALYNSPFSTRWFVITFGTDTSLTTGPGWDNVTGVGTPNGLNFINGVAP